MKDADGEIDGTHSMAFADSTRRQERLPYLALGCPSYLATLTRNHFCGRQPELVRPVNHLILTMLIKVKVSTLSNPNFSLISLDGLRCSPPSFHRR